MASVNDAKSITATLSGTTADTVTLNQLWPAVEVVNADGSNDMFVSMNGTNAPTTAVANGAGMDRIPKGTTKVLRAIPIQNGTGVGTIVLSVVGNGGAYTITGVQ